MPTPNIKALVERLMATVHQINSHWWNRRSRPTAPDIYEAATALTAQAQETEALRAELANARFYVEDAVKAGGGIDGCEMNVRLDLEKIDALLKEDSRG